MPLLLLIGCLAAVGVFLLIRAVISAPEGEEDQQGFHFTSLSPVKQEPISSSPIMLSTADVLFSNIDVRRFLRPGQLAPLET